jgi:hypothetical protein
MKTATSGRSALCFTIGLLLCFAGPLHAAPAALDKPFQPNSIAQAGHSPLAAPPNLRGPKMAAEVAAADDLTEADRAAQEETKPPLAVASNDDQAPRPGASIAGNDHSVWDETSLIGKIFIGLGSLLTVASAARMFMA